jgi:hypothetical protein
MATNFPSSLDTSTQQPTISSTDEMDDSGKEHDVVHTNHSGAIIALETKLGTGDSNAVADAVLMGTGSGTSGWDTSPTFKGAVTIGVDDTGHDFKAFGATSGSYMLWDESADALIVNAGPVFATAKMQTGQSSYTQEPWSNSTIALGNFGSIGTQGSYRTTMAWNFERGTDSNWHHLDINSYPQAGAVEIGNSGIIFRWQADFETDHADLPTDVLIMDADALYPATTDVTDLGTSAKKFAIGYINYIFPTDGSASYPSYAFGSDTDTGFYHYDTNRIGMSVGGNNVWYVTEAGNNVWKTHTNDTYYGYSLGASHAIHYLGSHGTTTMGGIYVTSSGYMYTRAGNAWRTRQASSEFRPYYDNAMSCGTDAAEWTEVWAYDTSVNHSDVNAKTDIVDTTLGLDFIKSLRPRQYKWKDGGVRNHQGFIAQEVKAVLDSQGGTDAASQSMWIDTSIKSEPQLLPDHDDPETFIEVPASNYQALRYGELTAPIVKAIQELEARVASLED